MAGETENWRLILEAARALTAAGRASFTRISVYEWIWRRHPRSDHDRPAFVTADDIWLLRPDDWPRAAGAACIGRLVGRGI